MLATYGMHSVYCDMMAEQFACYLLTEKSSPAFSLGPQSIYFDVIFNDLCMNVSKHEDTSYVDT